MYSNSQKGFVEIVLLVVAFLVLVGVGTYWFVSNMNPKLPKAPTFTQTESQSETSSTDLSDSTLEVELNSLQFEDPTLDLGDIDKDLNRL